MAFDWLNEKSRRVLKNGYLSENESAEERIDVICNTAESILGIPGFAQKLKTYMSNGWVSLSSPIWANFGKKRAMPISCFSSYVGDSISSILHTAGEVGVMTKMGGGTSGYFGDVRGRGAPITDNGTSSGVVHFLELFQTTTDVISQGSTRRGRFSPYLPIEHPDAEEFLDIMTEGHPIQTMTPAITVTDKWLQEMKDGDSAKRKLWAKVLRRRTEVGIPYIFFYDNAQRHKSVVYKGHNAPITNSQLCSELLLPVTENESFVCDLASVNVLHYDEYKDTDLVETVAYLLDAVMTEFIEKLEAMRDSGDLDDQRSFMYMQRAYTFAVRHRSIGVGVLGLHSYYQKNSIPFVSEEANKKADEIFKHLKERTYKASAELAEMLGECEMTEGYGLRFAAHNAIAPTTTSAFILGQVSQSIEPLMSNYYIKDLAKIKEEIKNKELERVLEEKGHNTVEVWKSIAKNDGSVQHLTDILSDHEREVFLTFAEMDQKGIITQAAIRQKHLDQTQSMNLMVRADASAKDVNALTLYAHEVGLPTLYYQHSTNAAQQFAKTACVSCEA